MGNQDSVRSIDIVDGCDVDSISFSHIQLYVDHVEDLHVYKELEERLFDYSSKAQICKTMEEKKKLWGCRPPSLHTHGRDVVKQLLSSCGFCVTGARYGIDTRTVLVTSKDPEGVQILVTAEVENHESTATTTVEENHSGMFAAANVRRFFNAHNGRQGVGVLAFAVKNIETIRSRYQQLHPSLVVSYQENPPTGINVFEVYAYYTGNDRSPDKGTILRFLSFSSACSALGFTPIKAKFATTSLSAYCDHWVSNVINRTDFLSTLRDTLGFAPKVDFNAGVVAAGEAQIESTVTGNSTSVITIDQKSALRDQSQVFLPINNTISSVGHVHCFLEQLGQGVQHTASRVENLVSFVQRVNEYREITGEGISFLQIPRSYYGVLTSQDLEIALAIERPDGITKQGGEMIIACLHAKNVLNQEMSLSLEIKMDELASILDNGLVGKVKQAYETKKADILEAILRSRFKNMYNLLGDSISEAQYMGIVRNQILVDIQNGDILYQIFTCSILQRDVGEEAPFFEFIQRVCSGSIIKPGCGGFGIRNFLTLFLSIEASKAMQEVASAKSAGDLKRQNYAQQMLNYFSMQLTESNPVLTAISDAMAEEATCQEQMSACRRNGYNVEAEQWKVRKQEAAERKCEGNQRLLECSARYNDLMKSLREETYHTASP